MFCPKRRKKIIHGQPQEEGIGCDSLPLFSKTIGKRYGSSAPETGALRPVRQGKTATTGHHSAIEGPYC